jgi:hypothetical protein
MRGTPWHNAVADLAQDPAAGQAVLANVDSAYHSERTLVPAELWRAILATVRQEPSFPIRTPEGYYVIIAWRLTRRGDTADLNYVREEIRSRLAIAERQEVMDRLLENLRSSHIVQILISSVPQDSVSLKSRE